MTETSCAGWREFLTLLDGLAPVIRGDFVREWPPGLLSELASAQLVSDLAPARTLACDGCAEAPSCDVIYAETHHGKSRPLLVCPHCGLTEPSPEHVRRWQMQPQALVGVVGQSLALTGGRAEPVPGRVWRLGRLRPSTSPWSVWFGLHLHRRDGDQILAQVRFPPQSLLLVPAARPRVPLPTGVLVGSLTELTTWTDGELAWDRGQLNELLAAGVPALPSARKPVPTRRQTRAADIEALVSELQQHVRAARDHAFHTRDVTGVPQLLPRPAQKDLARRLGITESRVSRSLNDPAALQLQLLWNLADDLDQVLRCG